MSKNNRHQREEAELIRLFGNKDYTAVEGHAADLCRAYPKHGFYWKALGTARNLLGDLPASVQALSLAAELLPNDAELLSNLGCSLRKLKRNEEAEAVFLKALRLNPDSAPALNNLGFLYKDQERYDEAETVLRRALELRPGYGEALNNLGMVLSCAGRYEEAQEILRQVLAQNASYPEAWNNLGIALDGKPAEAETAFRKALDCRPAFPQACIGLANCLKEQGRVEEGLTVLHESLRLSPEHEESYVTLGGLLMELGDISASEQAFTKAISLDPTDTAAHSLRMFCMTYSDVFTTAQRLEAAHSFGKALSSKAKPYTQWQRSESPRLRVGMVSGDFRNHPGGYFLENLLRHLDPAAIELFAYSSNRKTDELTERIRPFFEHWTLIQGLSDRSAAQRIHDDGLDILLDLSGHTAFNRLGVFAHKPAPVQASWLGYWATTGVEQMDAFIVDAAGVPSPENQPFTETLRTLPTRLCFAPPADAPDVAPLPALSKGVVTFGCFQNLSKISDATLRLWQPIFAALPCRLRLQAKQLRDETARKRILSRLAAHGIPPERVELVGPTKREAYLAAHAEVDIILDTVPYNGGTTTCEALWMGVPTLTLAGKSLIDRQGASLLTAARLDGWITEDAQSYVAKALHWATHLEELAALRQGLREYVTESPLFDGKSFSESMSALLSDLAGKRPLRASCGAMASASPSATLAEKGITLGKGSRLLGEGVLSSPCRIHDGVMLNCCDVGGYSYVTGGSLQFCTVGNYCSIAHNVTVALPHRMDILTTSPLAVEPLFPKKEMGKLAALPPYPRTVIGSDVWIGTGVCLKAGVHIGDGAIIGAGSVVTKDIPPFTVAAGNPCRIIRKRFPDALIERILSLRWFDYDWSGENIDWETPETALAGMEQALSAGFAKKCTTFAYTNNGNTIQFSPV